ncbi:hypothetical protein BpHYR1_020797 [Brachionus plicatilis]|uniref:Uncharacterized protein n=1 Tax=Brachionus plicatilis TaxID=10195 RepID=A0A3M7S949_BRAPC|nr:hypothetical protein BpHYR1_020797 [Brachionus plicatilis]
MGGVFSLDFLFNNKNFTAESPNSEAMEVERKKCLNLKVITCHAFILQAWKLLFYFHFGKKSIVQCLKLNWIMVTQFKYM